MERLAILRIALAAASIAAVCAPMMAQAGEDASAAHLKIRHVPEAVAPAPFPAESGGSANVAPIEYRSIERMTEQDRLLASNAESSIGEYAGHIGLELNQGQWSYRQVVCPAMPNHIFLRYTRNSGTGDVSIFTASIPRDGEGRVRIIPIQLRGYSLWSPAPINALTISAFNHIRAEEHPEAAPDWLGAGLCYAALAGGHPVAAKLTGESNITKLPAAMPAELMIPIHGGEEVSFMDMSASPRLMEWTMIFNRKGKLMKAKHVPSGLLPVGAVPPLNAGELKGRPVPPTIVNLPDDEGR